MIVISRKWIFPLDNLYKDVLKRSIKGIIKIITI